MKAKIGDVVSIDEGPYTWLVESEKEINSEDDKYAHLNWVALGLVGPVEFMNLVPPAPLSSMYYPKDEIKEIVRDATPCEMRFIEV